ncbi:MULTISPECIES: GntR family transcriptional regulator [unclassified Rhizobium]|uniref:GntR family transcriptional regulator n=1 Tax=unclassified Rhizobium TaxID=2613769 RepID=UPI0006F44675|nr:MULTISPECIES: GntR family transcriptional regulator [unclassified Rhizobium]KQV33643.1 GntR family transcriptional regulator [Rhizobium sp. Root1212]KRD23187.1 GntR family transcriptional regulator [Rhizobium sp. Root268]
MTNKPGQDDEQSLVAKISADIRRLLISGEFKPGEKLSEQQMASQFGISRNTLREVFRLLSSQGLLTHIPNRGAFVAAPDEADVIDIYRVRSVIQKGAVQAASPGHPALARMWALAAEAETARADDDWRRVGTLNMEFHRAMVELCDSPRLSAGFDLVLAELRLVFGQLEDTSHLHEPYIALNVTLLEHMERGDTVAALAALDAYLVKSERSVLAALQRRRG